jgi:hypothetical protein
MLRLEAARNPHDKPPSPSPASSPPKASCSASTGPRTTSHSTTPAANHSAIPPPATSTSASRPWNPPPNPPCASTSTPPTPAPPPPTDSSYSPAGPPPAPPTTQAREPLTTPADQPAPCRRASGTPHQPPAIPFRYIPGYICALTSKYAAWCSHVGTIIKGRETINAVAEAPAITRLAAQFKRRHAAGLACPWPSVKQPTVRTDRPRAPIPSAIGPWTPRHSGPQRDKMTHHGTEKKRATSECYSHFRFPGSGRSPLAHLLYRPCTCGVPDRGGAGQLPGVPGRRDGSRRAARARGTYRFHARYGPGTRRVDAGPRQAGTRYIAGTRQVDRGWLAAPATRSSAPGTRTSACWPR